jgi:hypothetical protein
MQITIRTLLASVAASAVFGGAIGALATAATSSQASPQAIAAAVQKVSDQTAQRELRVVDLDLKAINDGTDVIQSNQKALQAAAESIEKSSAETCWNTGSSAQRASC